MGHLKAKRIEVGVTQRSGLDALCSQARNDPALGRRMRRIYSPNLYTTLGMEMEMNEPLTYGRAAWRPYSYPPVHRSCPPPHRRPHTSSQQTSHIRCPGPGTGLGRPPAPRLASPAPPCEPSQGWLLNGVREEILTQWSLQMDLHAQDRYQTVL